MSKYKLKIVQENGLFVGYCLQNDEVIAKTAPCKDSTSASRNLSILTGKLQSPQVPPVTVQKSFVKSTPPASVPISYTASKPPQPSTPRKCCGRG